MYSVSDISYYNSGDTLDGQMEYSETICILESEQMAYRLIVTISDSLVSDLELAVFLGYGTELSSMRIKVFIPKDQMPTVIKGPFTLPRVVCTNGRQYSIFKHNTILANQEFVYVWGTLPSSSTQKLLLSLPASSNFISFMVDVCIPNTMTNLQLMLKSTGGSTWSEGSYITVFDYITSSILLSTTLSEQETVTLPFPVGIPTIPLDIQLIIPTSTDRRLIAIWGEYGGVHAMVGILYYPFPYYQHMMKRIHVVKNEKDEYSLHFINLYETPSMSSLELVITSREHVVGSFTLESTATEVHSFSAAIRCPAELVKGILFPETAIDTVHTARCNNGNIAYERRCDSLGNWEKPEGLGCYCSAEVDENGIEWRQVNGNAIIQRACGNGMAGNIQRTCSPYGEWLVTSGECKPLTCPSITSADLTWEQTVAGAVATIPCHTHGHALTRLCNLNGEWDSVIQGKCVCDDLVENGIFWNHTDSSVIRQYPCGEGYTGSISRKCSRKGMWLPVRNQCYRIKCDELVENGAVYPKTASGESVTVSCPLPYTGTIRRICQYNGKWGYVFDDCKPPSCESFITSRNTYGCLVIDVLDRMSEELVEVQLVPKPSALDSSFRMLLPGTICDLDINQPYSILMRRTMESKNASIVCQMDSIYFKQQCETMITPILREITTNETDSTAIGIRVMVEVPYCYDLVIHSLQVRVECIDNCAKDRSLVLSHVCHTPCLPGSLIVISSQTNLSSSKSYSITARAVPERSILALSSVWSDAFLLYANPEKIVLQPVLSVIPKNSHSVKLAWSLNKESQNIAINNYILHIFVSNQNEHTTDPRYLKFLETHPICTGNDLCRKNFIIVPIGNNNWRYVFILETSFVQAGNISIKNSTATYIVPEKPMVETTVTNYDTFANITFFNSNMEVKLNCSVLDVDKRVITQFLISMDYGEKISQVFGDLKPTASYNVICWIRDILLSPYSFSIDLKMIDFVPVMATLNITRSYTHYADVSFSVNRQGTFKCMALRSYSEEYLVQVTVPVIEEYGKTIVYTRPLNTIHSLIPVRPIHTDSSYLMDEDAAVYVACIFADYYMIQTDSLKMIRIKGPAPVEDNPLEIISSVPPPDYEGVYPHANLTFVFATEFSLKVSNNYYFIVEPVDQLGAAFPYKRREYVDACMYDVTEQSQILCEGHTNTFSYEPLIVHSRDCIQNKTKLIIPLPHLDSLVHYGIRTSLPDMLTDALSKQSFAQDSLFYGKYLVHFTSMASSPIVYSKMVKPASFQNVSLEDDIIILFSGNGFVPSTVPFKFQRVFGEVLIEEALNQKCSQVDVSETETKLSIHISKCLGSLEPNTNYELFISSLCWNRNTKESPNTVHYTFRTLKRTSPPTLYKIEPVANSKITRNQNIHFQFNEPVSIGDGFVTVTIVDMLSQSIVFEEVKRKALDLLSQGSNAFVVSLPVSSLPFYPYSVYQVSWDANSIVSYQSISIPANTTHFYSVDESCNLVKPKQTVFPTFCTYYYDKSIPMCRCNELF